MATFSTIVPSRKCPAQTQTPTPRAAQPQSQTRSCQYGPSGTGENLEVVGGVVGGSAVDVVDIDEGATGWHGRVEVTPHVQSQLAVETDGGLEWEIVGAFREEEEGSVGGDWCGEEVAEETWSVVAGEACGIWVPGSWTWKATANPRDSFRATTPPPRTPAQSRPPPKPDPKPASKKRGEKTWQHKRSKSVPPPTPTFLHSTATSNDPPPGPGSTVGFPPFPTSNSC